MSTLTKNDFLKMMQNCIFKFNSQICIITVAYLKGKLLGENLEFQDFIDLYCKKNKLLSQSFSSKDFLWWLKNKRKKVSFNGYTIEGNPIEFVLSFKEIDEYEYLCEISYSNHGDYAIDKLTGVYVKESVNKKAELEIKKGNDFCFIIIDVDNFKFINDTYGHMYGDAVLANIGSILKTILCDGFVGRIGGDEFAAVIYGNTEYQRIWDILHNLSLEVNKYSNDNPRNANISVTVGCSRFPFDGIDYSTLFIKADKALYRGKRKGKKCFIIYNDEKHKDFEASLSNEYNIASADRKLQLPNDLYVKCFNILAGSNDLYSFHKLIDFLGNYFLCDRVVLYLMNVDLLEYKYNWCSSLNLSNTNKLNKNPLDLVLWDNIFSNKGVGIMDNINNLEKSNYSIFKLLESENVKSSIIFKLEFDDNLYGIIRIDSCTNKRKWHINEIDTIHNLSNILGAYLSKMSQAPKFENVNDYDQLTKLYNISKFYSLTQKAIDNNINTKYTLIGVNMEQFGVINDVFGYEVGDTILKEMANILVEAFGSKAIIGRSFGAHYLILDFNKSKSDLIEIFNNIKKKVALLRYNQIDGDSNIKFIMVAYNMKISDSIIESQDKLKISYAKAKSMNNSCFLMFDKEQENQYIHENELLTHFNEALLSDEFKIFLQPKIDIQTGKLIGAEALSRWNFKHESILAPNSYIPLLEQTGYINKLDYFVFEYICGYIHCCERENISLVPISVNLSKNISSFEKYIDKIEATRNDYNVNPNLIEIEVTETSFNSNYKDIMLGLKKLKSIGYTISMDDFGAGNSNLELLSLFDFDVIKIDKMFIDNIDNEKQLKILKMVISLANELNIKILCEGVETKSQLDLLKSLGCNMVQGFYFDKPIPANEFLQKYLLNNK